MSNSQGQRREIIRLPEIPRSSTPEPVPKRQRTSCNTSKNIANIPREARPELWHSLRCTMNCDLIAHTVLLYVLFCLIYMYCTLYVLYILHNVHTVHVPCFPVSDVEVSSSTSVHHTCSHLSKYSHTSVHLVTFHILLHCT